jgi:hypothetical protein
MENEQAKRKETAPADGFCAEKSGGEPKSLSIALEAFRRSARASTEKPDIFWARQRAEIAGKLQGLAPAKQRPVRAWISATAIVLLCLSFFLLEKPNLPAVEFAGGADEQLLIEVQRALNRKCPDALAPAELISREMDKNNRNGRK